MGVSTGVATIAVVDGVAWVTIPVVEGVALVAVTGVVEAVVTVGVDVPDVDPHAASAMVAIPNSPAMTVDRRMLDPLTA